MTSPRHRIRVLVILALVAAGITGAVLVHRAYYVRRFGVVAPGKLYRCKQPEGLQWSVLDRLKIRKVINLRTRVEDPEVFDTESAVLDRRGVEYVSIPVAAELPTYDQFRRFVREVRAADGAVLFHCAHGRNRTGFMAAAYMIVMHDWTVERAMADIESYGVVFESPESKAKRARLVEMLAEIRRNRREWKRRTDPAAETRPATAPAGDVA